MTRTITGYFVDPANGIAEPRTIEKSLDSYYSLLNCSCIDIVTRTIGDQTFDIICDDEALLRGNPTVSGLYADSNEAIFGPLFVCKFDGRDDVTSLSHEELDYVNSYVNRLFAIVDGKLHTARVLTGLGF